MDGKLTAQLIKRTTMNDPFGGESATRRGPFAGRSGRTWWRGNFIGGADPARAGSCASLF
jgi:hypothetical protein